MKKIWQNWKNISKKIGSFQTKIIFSIFYFCLIFPLGFILNFFKDFLKTKKNPEWENFINNASNLEQMKNQ